MLSFNINTQQCTKCGQCVTDCPARIISMNAEHIPGITPENEPNCYRCQHCLAICPTGALSILGVKPINSQALTGNFPRPEQLETLIKGRRSVRRYKNENIDAELLQKLLDVAWHAPTGVNSRQVLFTVLDDRTKLARLREEVMTGLGALARKDNLPDDMAFFKSFIKLWEDKKVDIIFRDAPHLLIASAPKSIAAPMPDCLIALSYFELFAQTNGVGTLWNGIAKWAINDLLPETRHSLNIPDNHIIGYVMTFGKAAVQYARTVQHGSALINRPF